MLDRRDRSRTFVQSPDVVLREEDQDGALLFNPDANQVRVINHTGLFVWKLCDGNHNLTRILDALRATYDGIPEDQLESQVSLFMDDMRKSGFIDVVQEQKA